MVSLPDARWEAAYLNAVIGTELAAAGHVVGLDSGLFADCMLGPTPARPAGDRHRPARGGRRAVGRVRRGDPLRRAVQRSARLAGAGDHLPDQPPRERTARPVGPRRRGAPVPLRLDVYGACGDELATKDALLRPVTPYAESKVRVEDDLVGLADTEFSPVFLRNATAFGFSPGLRADIVLNNLVGPAVLSGTVLVLSDGTPWRPLVHARDIAATFAAALVAPHEAVHAQAFNIGTDAVLLFLPDLLDEVRAALRQIEASGASWVVAGDKLRLEAPRVS